MILTRPKMSYQQEKTKTFEIGSLNKNIHWPLGTLIQDEWSDGLMWVDHIRLDAGKK